MHPANVGARATSSRPAGPIWRPRIFSTTAIDFGPLGYQTRPSEVAGDHSHHPVAELLLVDQDSLAGCEPPPDVTVEIRQDDDGVVVRPEWDVGPRDSKLVVGVKIVWGGQQRHDAGEALAA